MLHAEILPGVSDPQEEEINLLFRDLDAALLAFKAGDEAADEVIEGVEADLGGDRRGGAGRRPPGRAAAGEVLFGEADSGGGGFHSGDGSGRGGAMGMGPSLNNV